MSAPRPNLTERIMKDEDFIISKTDTTGKITYCNQIFMEMSVLPENELLGKPHSIIRHPDMPKAVFKLLWERIDSGKEVFAYVKNLSADGSFYWVFANVTPSYDITGKIIGHYSVRRKPNPKALEIIKPLYEEMLRVEKSEGMNASMNYLTKQLEKEEVSYDELIANIQD